MRDSLLTAAFLAVSTLTLAGSTLAGEEPFEFDDRRPRAYHLTARASKLDSRAKEHPEIDFVFEKDGKVQDLQHAMVNTRVKPRGKLVIWLMRYNEELFERISSYGLHGIQVHYANRWFSKVCREKPVGEQCRGNVRLEAATGLDVSDRVDIPKPDSMRERSYQFVKWLAKENPQANWDYFLDEEKQQLRWEHVIIAGSSHGSTTAARFAKHQKVSRVVMFCGPRDQYQSWQSLPSATPTNRYYGFSHMLDAGWTADHYCRSWELIGLHEYGPIVNVDKQRSPYGHTRRLVTDFDVKGNTRRAHSSVVPGGNAGKNKRGEYLHEDVWRYLFTHDSEKFGTPVPQDEDCEKDQR